jgi:hypothetical protein
MFDFKLRVHNSSPDDDLCWPILQRYLKIRPSRRDQYLYDYLVCPNSKSAIHLLEIRPTWTIWRHRHDSTEDRR